MTNTTKSTTGVVRILLADDHTVMRAGLRLLLERHETFEVIGEAADGREAVQIAAEQKPAVVVMDVAMPHLNGVEAARQILSRAPDTAIVMLSMHSDESYVLRSLKAGARAYLLKDSAEADLIAAIQAIIEGRSFFSPGVRALLKEDYIYRLQKFGSDDTYELLTAREREVLQLVAEGRSNKEVASLLGLSLYTVETHRTHILQKLNLHSVPELILYAVRKGIIS
ncbi:MAG TPA: response regulator transcription factor [Bryobacteraceae bacterium]|nr:response regulator transcription factor [Bryobacteraceae bacterium]